MKIKIKDVEGLNIPQSNKESDTGYDIIATSDPIIVGEKSGDYWKRVDYIEYKTNLFIEPPQGESRPFREWPDLSMQEVIHEKFGYTLIFPRSSISKYNLVLHNGIGLADHSYRGELICRFSYQWQPEDFIYFSHPQCEPISFGKVNLGRIYKKGDKIAQLVAAWKEEIEWEVVGELNETDRGNGSFGSSGGNSAN